MTRSASLRRLATWAVGIVVFTCLMYFPTLAGGHPWSWVFGDFPPIVTFLLGGAVFGVPLFFAAHFWFPRTSRWPELERAVAWQAAWHTAKGRPLEREEQELLAMRAHDLYALVRPHVLERARRGR